MSTDAAGDGEADVAGASEPDVAVEGGEPSAGAAAEPAAAGTGAGLPTAWDVVPSAWDTAAPAGDDGDGGGPTMSVTGQAATGGETDEPGQAGEPDESGGDDAGGAAAEYDEDAGYDEDAEHDDELEHDEGSAEYDGYEAGELAEPQRARRWPRVLLGLGFLALAGAIVGGAVAIVGMVTHGFNKPVKVTYTKSALFSLKTGDCFDPRGQEYTLIPCDSPHVAEVFGTFTLGGAKWPGAAGVAREASSGCDSRLAGYLNPQLAISVSSTYVYPDSVAWQAGVRTVICEVRATSGQLTGSVRQASATEG